MKRQEIFHFLYGKMDFDSREGTRHTFFYPRMEQKRIALPKVMTLTRSSKEVPFNNQKGIAEGLHYSLEELRQGVGCTLSGATGNFSLCVNLLNFIHQRHEQYGPETVGFLSPMGVSIELILAKAAIMWSQGKKTSQDVAKLQSLLEELATFQSTCHHELQPFAKDIVTAIASSLKKHPA